MTKVFEKLPRRKLSRYLLVAVLIGMLVLVGVVWYVNTDSFQSMVRNRLVAELEKITGGKVELGGFHSIPFRLRVDVRDLTIHGREAPGEVPYAHVDRLVAQVRIISALGAEFGFDSLVLDHPVVHFIVYPDGTTNQPQPKIKATAERSTVERLLSLSVSRLDVQSGELLWENQRIPVSFSASDVSARLAYSHFRRRFESSIVVGKVDTKFKDFRLFAWRAEAHFNLRSNYVEVSSLKWFSGSSRLEAKGRLTDFRQPKIDGTYDGVIDLAEFGAIARRRELQSGVLDLHGKGSWSFDQFASDGKLQIHNVNWQSDNLSLRNASLGSDFSLTNQQFRLTKMEGRLLEGSASGDLEVTNWLNVSAGTAPSRIPQTNQETKVIRQRKEQQGALRLRFKGLSVPALAVALTTPARPLDRLNLAGVANGSVDENWKGSLSNAEAQISIEITPPARPSPSELPVTASARVTYRALPQELEVGEFFASTPASQLRASGKLSSVSNLRISASTTDLGEWKPILNALRGPSELAVSLNGRASFNGIATGSLSGLSFAGDLQVSDFDSPAATHTPARQLHWDSFTAYVLFALDHFAARNATLRHGNMDIHFDVSASLSQRQFTDNSPFAAHVEVRNGDLAQLENLLGYDYPVSGQIDLHLQASGTRLDPHGEGQVRITSAALYGQPVGRFTSDLRFANEEAQLNNIQATVQDNGGVTGSVAYNLSDKSFHLNLTGTNFELAQIGWLPTPRFAIQGHMGFMAQGSGSFEEPMINAKIELRDLTFDQERAGDFTIDAVTQGADLHLSGRSHFTESDLAIDGTVHLRNDWATDLTLRFNHLDVDSLLRAYLRGRLTGHSAVAGDMRITGNLRRPREELNVTASLNDLFVDIENIKLRSEGPVRFALRNQVFNLERLHLIGDLTDFTAHGAAQLGADRRLNLQANGRVDLRLIESFNPDFTSSGTVTVAMTFEGTTTDPLVQGQLQIRDGAISYASLPSGLSNMNGSLLFNQHRLRIETLTARTGGGLVNMGGTMTLYHGQANFDLTVQGQDVRLRYPPGVSATANADVRLTGTSAAATLTGDVTITKLAVTPGFDFASYLEKSKQSSAVPNPNSLTNRLKLDVHIVTTSELQMQTALAKLSGDADLRLRGTAAKPVLLGRVDILEGEISFGGAKYRLERGDVSFTNPVRIEPVLDLQATTRVSDYDITIGLTGTPDKLSLNYRSEPPLPSADILALLSLGRPREESAVLQSSSSFNPQTSNLILNEALSSMSTSRAQRLFGVSRIKVDPQGAGTETSLVTNAPQVTIEQQVVNNLILTYSTNVSQTSQQTIQVEYTLTRNVSIVSLRDYNGVVSFAVRLRKRRK